MNLHLTPETEALLKEQAAQSGKSVEALALEAIGEKLAAVPSSADRMSNDEWIRQFNEWVAAHPIVTHFVDDSRDSIYEGRGE